MQDVLFIQFFSRSSKDYYDLSNGFSDTYALCRSRGEFFWQPHEPDSSKWYTEAAYIDRPLPIRKGTAYVSASYINHLYQAYVWARQYPEIRFVVGGPVAASRSCPSDAWAPLYFSLREGAELPENLVITGRSVEEIFGVPNFSGSWWVEIPYPKVPPEAPVYLSYTLDNGCYWGRCIYCNIKEAPRELFRRREAMDFEFAHLPHPGKKIIRLNTGSMTPRYIRQVLPHLPSRADLEYRTFMRASKAENLALEKVLETSGADLSRLTIGIGVEFPSRRMLAYMDKGITPDDILETLRICGAHGIKVNGNIILGWNNLIETDISELERFLDRMPPNAMTSVQLRWLYAHPRTPIHEEYRGDPICLGPFYLGFKVDIPDDQQARNQETVRLIETYCPQKGVRIEGLGNVKAERDYQKHAAAH
jgi:hypothetical protein